MSAASAAHVRLTTIRIRRAAPWALGSAIAVFLVWWLLIGGEKTIANDPDTAIRSALNAIVLASLLFITASGFTLIFGLMRVVNMAHGTFYLFAGFTAITLQRRWVGKGDINLNAADVDVWKHWVAPILIAALLAGVLGLAMQQLLLRWNQGQDLRQALITIAISVIASDQMLAHFNSGIAKTLSVDANLESVVTLGFLNDAVLQKFRMVVIALAVVVGVLLWLWLKRTRTGMVIRAGVDDRAMVSALGINIQRVFAIAFFIGAFLAGLGGGIGASYSNMQDGEDGRWLLFSLLVVIIGGMGSLGGAAIGSLIFAFANQYSTTYLPNEYANYSVIFTFVVLALVLSVRPLGLFGRPA